MIINMTNINHLEIQQQIMMQQNAELHQQQQLPSWQVAPNSVQPPQQIINNNNMINIPQPMNMMNNMNNMMNGVQRMNINVNIPPQPQMNGVQGSPGRYTPDHQYTPDIITQQQGHNSPQTPYRKNSGGSYDGIMKNYISNTAQGQSQGQGQGQVSSNKSKSKQKSRGSTVNGSRTPNDGYGQSTNKIGVI